MKKLFLTAAAICVASLSFSQNLNLYDLGCGTTTSKAELQRVYDFVQLPTSAFKTTAGGDTIPLSIHIVGDNNGGGYYSLDNLFTIICQLNQRYAPVGFYFHIKWPITYINNSSYYVHDFNTGAQMMSQYNISGTTNVYFVQDPAGNCGYYTYGQDALAIGKTCAATNSTTLTHELGHYFGLPHTFSGWENGNIPGNPEKVTRGAGANCSSTGDGFCDTWADYLDARWQCPYNGVKYDINNDKYHPDSSIYMSYSLDACQSRFSGQEISEMQYQLHNQRAALLNVPHVQYSILNSPVMAYPNDTVYANYQKLIWHKVPGAEFYHVKITGPNVPVVFQEALVSDTSLLLTFNTTISSQYFAIIEPLSGMNVCRANVYKRLFYMSANTTTLAVSNELYKKGSIVVSPNPCTSGTVNITLTELQGGKYTIQLMSLTGQKMLSAVVDHIAGSETVQFQVGKFPAGMYFIDVENAGQHRTEKLVIAQ